MGQKFQSSVWEALRVAAHSAREHKVSFIIWRRFKNAEFTYVVLRWGVDPPPDFKQIYRAYPKKRGKDGQETSLQPREGIEKSGGACEEGTKGTAESRRARGRRK